MTIRALPARGGVREAAALPSRRHDVRADVAQRRERAVLLERAEAPEPAPRDVLEEHALDRILRAEGEDLLEDRLERIAHGRNGDTG